MTVIEMQAKRFPQLYVKLETGVSQSELYRASVRKGYRYEGSLSHFAGSAGDSLTPEQNSCAHDGVPGKRRRRSVRAGKLVCLN